MNEWKCSGKTETGLEIWSKIIIYEDMYYLSIKYVGQNGKSVVPEKQVSILEITQLSDALALHNKYSFNSPACTI